MHLNAILKQTNKQTNNQTSTTLMVENFKPKQKISAKQTNKINKSEQNKQNITPPPPKKNCFKQNKQKLSQNYKRLKPKKKTYVCQKTNKLICFIM